ncbi:4338_t:CDS:10, partial [Dentiscutata heterogama]
PGECISAKRHLRRSLGFAGHESAPGEHINAEVACSKVSLDVNQYREKSLGFVGRESTPDKHISAKWHLRSFQASFDLNQHWEKWHLREASLDANQHQANALLSFSGFARRESAPGAKWHLRRYFCFFFSSFVERESAPGKVAPSGSFTRHESASGERISVKFSGFVGHESAPGKTSPDVNQHGQTYKCRSFIGHESTLVETYKYRSRPLK